MNIVETQTVNLCTLRLLVIVRTRRLELPRTNVHQPLKLARLPIPPRAQNNEVNKKKS